MAKDDSKIANDPKLFQQIVEAAKRATNSNDASNPATVDKIDQIISILQSDDGNPEHGRKSQHHGRDEDYDDAVKG